MCTPYLVRCQCRASHADATLSRHRDWWRFYVVQPAGYRLAIAQPCGIGWRYRVCWLVSPGWCPVVLAGVVVLVPVVLAGVVGLVPVVLAGVVGRLLCGAGWRCRVAARWWWLALPGWCPWWWLVLSGCYSVMVAGVVGLLLCGGGWCGRAAALWWWLVLLDWCPAVVTLSGYLFDVVTNCLGVGRGCASLVATFRPCGFALVVLEDSPLSAVFAACRCRAVVKLLNVSP